MGHPRPVMSGVYISLIGIRCLSAKAAQVKALAQQEQPGAQGSGAAGAQGCCGPGRLLGARAVRREPGQGLLLPSGPFGQSRAGRRAGMQAGQGGSSWLCPRSMRDPGAAAGGERARLRPAPHGSAPPRTAPQRPARLCPAPHRLVPPRNLSAPPRTAPPRPAPLRPEPPRTAPRWAGSATAAGSAGGAAGRVPAASSILGGTYVLPAGEPRGRTRSGGAFASPGFSVRVRSRGAGAAAWGRGLYGGLGLGPADRDPCVGGR